MSKRPHFSDYPSPNIVIVPTVSFCCGPSPKKPKLGEHSHLPLPKTRIPKKSDTTLQQNVMQMPQVCVSSLTSNNSAQDIPNTSQKVSENVVSTSTSGQTQPKSFVDDINKCHSEENLHKNPISTNTSWASNFLMSIGQPKKQIRLNLSMSRKKECAPNQNAAPVPPNASFASSTHVTKSAYEAAQMLSFNKRQNEISSYPPLQDTSTIAQKTCHCNNQDPRSFAKITKINVKEKYRSETQTKGTNITSKVDIPSVGGIKSTPSKTTYHPNSKIYFEKSEKIKNLPKSVSEKPLKKFVNFERKRKSKDKDIVYSDSKSVTGKLCEAETINRKYKSECRSTAHSVTKSITKTESKIKSDSKSRTMNSEITKSHNSSYPKKDKFNYIDDKIKNKYDLLNKNIKGKNDKVAKISEELHHKEIKYKLAKSQNECKNEKNDKSKSQRPCDETITKADEEKNKPYKAEIFTSKFTGKSATESKTIYDKQLQAPVLSTPIKSIVKVTDGFEMNRSPDLITKPKNIDLRSKLSRCNYLQHIKKSNRIHIKDKKLPEEERENLIITIENNKEEQTLKSEDDDEASCIKRKTKRSKYKKIKLVINVICEKPGAASSDSEGSDDEENHNCSSNNVDLSFLDDLDVDEIVESLKQSGNDINCIDLTLISDDDDSSVSTLDLQEISRDEIKQEPIEIIDIDDEDNPIEKSVRFPTDKRFSIENFTDGKVLLNISDIKVESCDNSQSFSTKETPICNIEKNIKSEIIDENTSYVKGRNDTAESLVHPVQRNNGNLQPINDSSVNRANDREIVEVINVKKEPEEIAEPTYNDIIVREKAPIVDSNADVQGQITTYIVSSMNNLSMNVSRDTSFIMNVNNLASSETTPLDAPKTDAIIRNDSKVMPIKETTLMSDINDDFKSEIADIEVKNTTETICNVDVTNNMKMIEEPKDNNTTKWITDENLVKESSAAKENENIYSNIAEMQINARTSFNNECNIKIIKHKINKTSKLQDSKTNDVNTTTGIIVPSIEAIGSNISKAIVTTLSKEASNSAQVHLTELREGIQINNKDQEVPTKQDDSGLQTNKSFNERSTSIGPSSVTMNTRDISDKREEKALTDDTKKSVEKTGGHVAKTKDGVIKTDVQEGNKSIEIFPLNAKEGETACQVTNTGPFKKVEIETLNKFDRTVAKKLEDRMLWYFKKQYSVTSLIHDGKFSKIFQCKDSEGRNFVTKFMKNPSKQISLRMEKMLKDLQHDIPKKNLHFVYLIDGFVSNHHLCLFMEYYPHNLAQVLRERKKSFHITAVQDLSKQLVTAVTILRHNNVVHSDIRPSHILMNSSNDQIKLCGFDSAYYIGAAKIMPNISTVKYRAPEVILGHSAGYSIDVWATALVMYEMATNRKLFYETNNNDMLYKQLSTLGPVPLDMLNQSWYSGQHFNGKYFLKRTGLRWQGGMNISIQKKPHVLISSIRQAYSRDWDTSKNKKKDMAKLFQFHRLLEQMLTIHPKHRLAIEFVYSNPFIFEFYDC